MVEEMIVKKLIKIKHHVLNTKLRILSIMQGKWVKCRLLDFQYFNSVCWKLDLINASYTQMLIPTPESIFTHCGTRLRHRGNYRNSYTDSSM